MFLPSSDNWVLPMNIHRLLPLSTECGHTFFGTDSKLLADNSNVKWEDDDVSASLVTDISGCSNNSVPTDDDPHEVSLEHELCLSALMFASLDVDELEAADDTKKSFDDDVMAPIELEQEMKTEG